jgi:hypothetical protein
MKKSFDRYCSNLRLAPDRKRMNTLAFTALLSLICSCCSVHETELALKKEDEAYRQLLQSQISADNDADSRLALARLYFDYHAHEDADKILSRLTREFPGEMEYLAWYGANNCKLAKEMFPWAFGMEKLYPVAKCLKQIDAALGPDPINYPVLMVKLNTAYEVDMFGSLASARDNIKTFDEHLKKRRAGYAKRDLAEYYYIAALIAQKSEDHQAADRYLARIIQDRSSPDMVAKARAVQKQLTASKKSL